MNNINKIFLEYEKTRESNKQSLENRKAKIYNQLPRLKAIEEEMVELGLEIAKSVLKEDNKAKLNSLKRKQKDLRVEKTEILASKNYGDDILELRYECDKCKDTGFVGFNKCSCFIQKQIEYNYMMSNLSETKENFDNFNLKYYSETPKKDGLSPRKNMEHIYRECIDYVNTFDKHNRNMLFIGRPGLGKTFLCHSIAKELLKTGKSIIYHSAPDLIDLVRKYKFNFENEEQSDTVLDNINTCDLLIIDDLGTELSTQFSGLVIYNILNKRMMESKKMIIATNLDVKEIIRDYSERITSRIFGSFDMFEFFGEDIRILMKMS
ncbi:MAG: ATP-binding protein [Firmicutes bacterium]|nr:ATP-binding protein [Bacillota bacterium]